MKRLALWGLALALIAGGCGGRKAEDKAAAQPSPLPAATAGAPLDSKLQQGRSMFRHLCADCHGLEGKGGSAAALNRRELRQKYPTEADLARRIKDGDPAEGMPPCGGDLRPQDLEALTAYVYSLSE